MIVPLHVSLIFGIYAKCVELGSHRVASSPQLNTVYCYLCTRDFRYNGASKTLHHWERKLGYFHDHDDPRVSHDTLVAS